MSAETLRRAAALMRERAEAATPGPWEVNHHGVLEAADEVRTILGHIANGGAEGRANARHVPSWHPAVALAVADWLDDTAALVDDPAQRLQYDGNALTVARAYLGVTP